MFVSHSFSKIAIATLVVGLLNGSPVWGQARHALVDACLQAQSRLRDIDPNRSLLISELAVLENSFTLKEVLAQLARDSREPGLRPLDIWQEWWDTQQMAELSELGGAHCDDQGLDESVTPPVGFLNGFPVQCPRAERQEVNLNPFLEDNQGEPHYELIALVNRFDLAPTDGAHCGEYRAIFARVDAEGVGAQGEVNDLAEANAGGLVGSGRNLVIFEAVLPNPSPSCGLDGCRAIAEYWEKLSDDEDPVWDHRPGAPRLAVQRGEYLRDFFLRGIRSERVAPVVRLDHYSKGTGQIRSNMFMDPAPGSGVVRRWQLREFKLARACQRPFGAGPCQLRVVPVSVKGNPFGELFGEVAVSPDSDALTAFQESFVGQVDDLMHANVNRFGYRVDPLDNAGQSNASGLENDYPNQLPQAGSGHPFLTSLEFELEGFAATPTQLARRAHVLSCGGCHNPPPAYLPPFPGAPDDSSQGLGGGLFWQASNGFTHVSELEFDPDAEVRSWKLSDALKQIFLPHRERVFERYLNSAPCRECSRGLAAGERGVSSRARRMAEESGSMTSAEIDLLESDADKRNDEPTLGGARRVH